MESLVLRAFWRSGVLPLGTNEMKIFPFSQLQHNCRRRRRRRRHQLIPDTLAGQLRMSVVSVPPIILEKLDIFKE